MGLPLLRSSPKTNLGEEWSSDVWRKITGEALPNAAKQNAADVRRRLNNAKSQDNPDVKVRALCKKKIGSVGKTKKAKESYGESALTATPDISARELETACQKFYNEMTMLKGHRDRLESCRKPPSSRAAL